MRDILRARTVANKAAIGEAGVHRRRIFREIAYSLSAAEAIKT